MVNEIYIHTNKMFESEFETNYIIKCIKSIFYNLTIIIYIQQHCMFENEIFTFVAYM